MASGTRGTNTQSEALRGILGQLADIKTFPDADIEWLLGLETNILQKLRAPVQDALANSDLGAGGGAPQGDPSMGGGAPMGPPPGMPMAGPAGPPGVPGLRQSPGAPNPDELRRLLTAGQ